MTFFFYIQVTNSKSKNKKKLLRVTNSIVEPFCFTFELLEVEKQVEKHLFSPQVTNLKVKLLLFCFRVTKSRLVNKKFHFEFLTRWVNFCFLTFKLRTWSWSIKKFLEYFSLRMIWTAPFYNVSAYFILPVLL